MPIARPKPEAIEIARREACLRLRSELVEAGVVVPREAIDPAAGGLTPIRVSRPVLRIDAEGQASAARQIQRYGHVTAPKTPHNQALVEAIEEAEELRIRRARAAFEEGLRRRIRDRGRGL